MTTVTETLTTAKKLLIDNGRIHMNLIDADGCMCALGAIGVATNGASAVREVGYAVFHEEGPALKAALALAGSLPDKYRNPEYARDISDVYHFNDRTDDDQDVLDVFDKAIAAAQGE